MFLAAWQSHAAVLEALLAGGASWDTSSGTGISAFGVASDAEVKRLLRAARNQPKLDASEDLLGASKAGNIEGVIAAAAAGADLESKDSHGQTALLLASWKTHLDVVKELVRLGADPNALSSDGIAPKTVTADAAIKAALG